MKNGQNSIVINTDSLKVRILSLKPLPAEWAKEFTTVYPEYNNLEGVNRIRNVAYTRVGDLDITEKMEALFSKRK